MNTFIDNDGNTIVTPHTAVQGAIGDVTIGAHVAVDIMTCASVDVLSAATPKGYFKEVRQEYGADASVRLGPWTVSAGAVYSRENDYSSITGTVGGSVELFQRNTTLSLGYGFTDSNIGLAGDSLFRRDLDSHTINASLTQVLHPRVVAQLSLFVGVLSGFQSSPYRMVALSDGAASPERMPRMRVRNAATARLRVATTSDTFLGLDYRFYVDDWQLMGHTAEVSFTHDATEWFSWRLRDRFYYQSASAFYRSRYDGPMKYMTTDRELSGFWSNLAGLKLIFKPPVGRHVDLSIDAKADITYQRFEDFPLLPERVMLVTEVGITVDF